MNAFYVTVSIPILLVLAGFNHAHGLTTFGKSNGQGQAQADVHGKPCTNQTNCSYIKGTTCIRKFCLCGDNTHPKNGICSAQYKGAGHICQKDDECVEGASCLVPEEAPKANDALGAQYKICQCDDDFSPTQNGNCSSGGERMNVVSGLLLMSIVLTNIY